MFKHLIYKTFSLPRFSKILIILLLDVFIIIFSSYMSLVIRLDEFDLFSITEVKYLASIEFFLIPIFVYLLFALYFQFYNSSFRYYNLGNNFYYSYPLCGIAIIILNVTINSYFSYGALIINILLIFSLVTFSRKLISEMYVFLENKFKNNSLIVCNSENLHRIFEYLNLNKKISIKGLFVHDFDKIDFKRYGDYKINNINNLNKIYERYNIKEIYADKFYEILKKKIFKKTTINILEVDDLFKIPTINIKEKFVDKYFKTADKINNNKNLSYYNDKTILITGAGGSIGKNLFFELINSSKPKKIILVEQDELKLFSVRKKYENINSKLSKQFNISFKLGNLSNDLFLKNIFLDNKNIECVLHAAAYKHVGFGEENVFSFIKNNIFVTYNLAKISIKRKVKKFIFISTDKAVNPKSVMGHTKNICEKIIIYLNNKNNLKNIFKIVRFGNVINSDGSVLPIFEKQIVSGGPVTVTNKEVTRYFMSIRNACQLVLNTIVIDKKIGIFILDMGKPYKILDIVKSMINFYLEKKMITSKPKIIFIGLQKGEKINEELVLGKNLVKTKIKNILSANETINESLNYSLILSKLEHLYIKNNIKNILHYLKNYD